MSVLSSPDRDQAQVRPPDSTTHPLAAVTSDEGTGFLSHLRLAGHTPHLFLCVTWLPALMWGFNFPYPWEWHPIQSPKRRVTLQRQGNGHGIP